MMECHHCGTVFKVVFDEDFEDENVNYCPVCGEEQGIELDFEAE